LELKTESLPVLSSCPSLWQLHKVAWTKGDPQRNNSGSKDGCQRLSACARQGKGGGAFQSAWSAAFHFDWQDLVIALDQIIHLGVAGARLSLPKVQLRF
jgi:hypothetical protein